MLNGKRCTLLASSMIKSGFRRVYIGIIMIAPPKTTFWSWMAIQVRNLRGIEWFFTVIQHFLIGLHNFFPTFCLFFAIFSNIFTLDYSQQLCDIAFINPELPSSYICHHSYWGRMRKRDSKVQRSDNTLIEIHLLLYLVEQCEEVALLVRMRLKILES